MKLINFDLESPSLTIIVVGLGVEWDLHNFANFLGFTFDAAQRSVRLQWGAPNVENPWGSIGNSFPGCTLRFQNVSLFSVSPRRFDATAEDDLCLAGVSKVIPEPGEFRHLVEWPTEQPFHLLFEFMSGQTIEIAADTAELLPRADAT